mgnify:CR=1 FL=1
MAQAALEGIRVLDLCIVLAGPTCGRTLGEFGADVIKIDDPSRPYDIAGNTDVNRGKRSININLKNPEGLAVFYKLLETADVVVENSRATTLARLGISYEQMKKHKPDIIHASLNAFGYDGPWAERAGWEQLAQATSGIQVRRGGRDGTPKLLPYPMNDYGTGLMGAYAVALAVHERNRTGEGQSVNSGLALTAGLLQSPYFLDYEGHQRDEPEGLGVRGFSAKSRLYKAADGWLYFHCPSDEAWKQLTALSDFAGLDEGNDDGLTRSLAEVLASKPRPDWAAGRKKKGGREKGKERRGRRGEEEGKREERKRGARREGRVTQKSMNESAFQYARPPVYTSEKSRCGSCPPKTRSAVSPSVPPSCGIQPRSRKMAAYTTAAPSRISATRSGRRGPFNAKSPPAGSLDG